MITIECPCGQSYQLESADVADQFCCPSCGKEATEALPAFAVMCGTHPDQKATHNCLNCAKPLCMDCVRDRGYFCSDECKTAVAEAEPDAVTAEDQELQAVGEQTEKHLNAIGRIARKTAPWVGLVVGVLVLWWVGRWWLAPKGKILASLPVPSEVSSFHFAVAGKDAVLVQANDELHCIRVPDLQKTWSASLAQWEEKVQPPAGGWAAPEDGVAVDHRDPLFLAQAHSDLVILHSRRQLLALAEQTGQLQWKQFDPRGAHYRVNVHAGGIWSGMANYSLVDGRPTATFTNAGHGQTAFAGGRMVMLTAVPRAAKTEDDPAELTAGSIHDVDMKSILATAQGKKMQPKEQTGDFRLQMISPADGRVLGEKVIALPYSTRLIPVDDAIALVTSTEVQLYRDQIEPVWKASVPATEELVTGAGLVIVPTEQGVVALDAKTGAEKWKRTDLRALTATIGPDAVYVSTTMSKEAFAASKFPLVTTKIGVTGPSSVYRVLLRLDPTTGQTRWGVRNIGEQVLLDGDKLFVVDRVQEMNLLADQLLVGNYSIRQLSPRTGDDIWSLLKAGDLYHCAAVQGKIVAVTASDPPSGLRHATCPYELVVVGGK